MMQLFGTDYLRQPLFPGRAKIDRLGWNFRSPTFLQDFPKVSLLEWRRSRLIQAFSHDIGFRDPARERGLFNFLCQRLRQSDGQTFHGRIVRHVLQSRKTIIFSTAESSIRP
jgi:hypothetical protein